MRLTDCWSLYFSDATVYQQYYLFSQCQLWHAAVGQYFPIYTEMVWEVVRWCWLLMENIDRVPGMDSTEKLSWWQKLNAQLRHAILI